MKRTLAAVALALSSFAAGAAIVDMPFFDASGTEYTTGNYRTEIATRFPGTRPTLFLIVTHDVREAPVEIPKRYEKWKDIVEISGPAGLMLIRGFRDEALRGEWKGYRSYRLNHQYCVIYQAEGDRLNVHVLEVTPRDYRRKS